MNQMFTTMDVVEGVTFKHPARKQPLVVIGTIDIRYVRVRASGGGIYRMKKSEVVQYMTSKQVAPVEKAAEPAIGQNHVVRKGSRIQHPARKNPMDVIEIVDRNYVRVMGAGGGTYRITMAEARKFLIV